MLMLTDPAGPNPASSLTAGAALHAGILSRQMYDLLVEAGLADRDLSSLTVSELSRSADDAAALASALATAVQAWDQHQLPDIEPVSLFTHGQNAETPAPHDDVRLADLLGAEAIQTRVFNTLISNGMTTCGDVRRRTVDSLLRLRNFGRLSLDELVAAGVLVEGHRPLGPPPEPEPDPGLAHGLSSTALPVDDEAVAPDDEAIDGPPGTVETLAQVWGWIRTAATEDQLEIMSLREARTLEEIAKTRGVTRERIRQIEAKGVRKVTAVVGRVAAHMPTEWHRQLASGITSEDALFGALMDPALDLQAQLRVGRFVLRTVLPTTRPARVFGHLLRGYWSNGSTDGLEQKLCELAEFGPYSDEDLAEALTASDVDEGLGRLILASDRSPLIHYGRARGWIRRAGAKRDACYLILNRAGRPTSIEALARMVEDQPRNLGAALDRDERFQKLYGLRKWALAAWDNSKRGGQYRNTRDAMTDLLTRDGPMTFGELVKAVIEVHPVTSWAVSNNLEHEAFGRLADGRYAMAFQGGSTYEEEEPPITADVDPPSDDSNIAFYVPVTSEVLRGSGVAIPRYVTWFAGLRRVPRKRTFETAGHNTVTLARNTGSATMSSIREEVRALRLDVDCLVRIHLSLPDNVAGLKPACPCHSASDSGGWSPE